MSRVLTHEELERKNYLLCFKSKEEIVDMLLLYEQENTQLKEENEKGINAILELIGEIVDLKSVLKEIREYIKVNMIYSSSYYDDVDFIKQLHLVDNEVDKLLEIIDKGIGKNE